jgi:formylglycine-generating enzyme required for sulfatase activity
LNLHSKAAVNKPAVNIPASYGKGTGRSTIEVIGINLLISLFSSDPQRMNEAMQSNNASQGGRGELLSPAINIPAISIPAINKPEIKVSGISYNFVLTECKAAISSSTGEVTLVASISNPSKSKDPTQSNNSTGKKQDLTEVIAALEKDMALIPAGKFEMGSPANEKGRSDNETQHEVTLTKPFYMGKYEVTQDQWEGLMGNNPSEEKGEKLPVTNVSWEDCQEFIKKLNQKTNGGYRLPTEAEWEYTCRAGTSTAYSFGDPFPSKDGNYYDSKIKKPLAVGSYKPNAFGLYDMHGNVFEWCGDWYGDYPAGIEIDPNGPAKGERRVMRGGSFFNVVSSARSSFRYNITPTDRDFNHGFRLVRTVDLKAENSVKALKTDTTKVTSALGTLEFTKVIATIEKDMMLIPAGKFMMGSPATEKGRSDNETQHEVTLTKPFYMGKYEVTQEQWESVMGNNPDDTKGSKLPVTNVSWEACQEFIKKLNAKTNGGFRLPTEAEWEYSCRAGTTTAYSFGDKITPEDVNNDTPKINKHKDEDGVMIVVKTHKPNSVGAYKPNAFGLYDMHGNVCEWCEDWYGDYPAGSVMDPKGPLQGEKHVVRGGSVSVSTRDVIVEGGESEFHKDIRFSPAKSFTRFGLADPIPNVIGFRLVKTK